MSGTETWESLGAVDRDKTVAEGVIELPPRLDKATGNRRVLMVRYPGDDQNDPGPETPLAVAVNTKLSPQVSEVDYVRLKIAKSGASVDARRLTWREAAARIAGRMALPILLLLAGVASLVGLIESDLEQEMGIVAAVLGIPAGITTIVRAAKGGS